MPMMMHHDSQPLYSRGSNYGLLNQVRLLRKAGAPSLQVLMITPSAGSKLYESTFASGQVFRTVGGRPVRGVHVRRQSCDRLPHSAALDQATQPLHGIPVFLQSDLVRARDFAAFANATSWATDRPCCRSSGCWAYCTRFAGPPGGRHGLPSERLNAFRRRPRCRCQCAM